MVNAHVLLTDVLGFVLEQLEFLLERTALGTVSMAEHWKSTVSSCSNSARMQCAYLFAAEVLVQALHYLR